MEITRAQDFIKPMNACYAPIFFERDWVQEKYYGWAMLHEESGIRVLRKRHAIVTKKLVMSIRTDRSRVSHVIENLKLARPFSLVILHDFSRLPEETGLDLAGRHFELLSTTDRLLNIGTFVIDLGQDEESLWKKLGPKSRNMIRKAEELGVQVRVTSASRGTEIDAFYSWYGNLAERLGLQRPDRTAVERMLDKGDLLAVVCIGGAGGIQVVNLVYLAPAHAYYFYGASAENVATGAGQLAQWETMRLLKSRGIRWYDLGGVPVKDPSNGIYKFKKSLGGDFVDLGSEYRWISPLVSAGYRVFRRLRHVALGQG